MSIDYRNKYYKGTNMTYYKLVFILATFTIIPSYGMFNNNYPSWLRILDAACVAWNGWFMIMNTIWWLDSPTDER